MINKKINKCPICGQELIITKMECLSCHTTIEGKFKESRFSNLTNEQQNFALIFIKNAGNIKAIEQELNISYPTVKKNLDELIEALGFEDIEVLEEHNFNNKFDVLNALKKGEITFEEAEKILKELKNND